MKYLQALSKKGVNKEDLPKSLQSKIDILEAENLRLSEADELGEEDIETVKQQISSLDEYLAAKIKKFNAAAYESQKANIKRMQEKRKELSSKKGLKEQLKKESEETKVIQMAKEPETLLIDNELPDSEKGLEEKLEELKNLVSIQPEKLIVEKQVEPDTQPLQPEDEDEEFNTEIEEFKKVGNAKPKSKSKGIILMAVGAFFMAWGGINLFKNR